MPRNTLGTNLNLCFTKLKRPLPPQSANHNSNEHHSSLHFCNSITNFNSLYNLSLDCNSNIPTSSSSTNYSTTISEESDYIYELATTPDLATVYASQRFFFSSPGHSNSIIDSSSSSMSSSLTSTLSSVEPRESDALVVDGSIAIPTYSPDPYLDFRISMQEMVEARGLTDIRGNWDLLHELLMCYLTLNPKSTHKYIVDAFADLIVCLMTSKSSQHLDPCAGSTRPIKVTTLPTEFSPYPKSNPRPLVKDGVASSTAP
ncbi:transcription repressor OFP12 isoform X1 [Capsicum annuum]|uniref:transcription repressor OFP12 isoform X1 n=1 Tax=Capsicum annuum TaxID=4072 RepID=UPI0007BF5307|nr:transcription repressor OFP12 isoform X1 [Capsicum annuum]